MRRLHVPLLGAAQAAQHARLLLPPAQAHKLAAVLRMRAGEEVAAFSEAAGEWLCRLVNPARGELQVLSQLRAPPPAAARGALLALVPLRPERTRFLVEKAVELGVGALLPLRSDRGVHALGDKALDWAAGAAEQCGRLALPRLLLGAAAAPTALDLLAAWGAPGPGAAAAPGAPLAHLPPAPRVLLVGDPGGAPASGLPWEALCQGGGGAQLGVLVGPEGGFSAREGAAIAAAADADAAGVSSSAPRVLRVRVSCNTLRSETAALALLALVSAHAAC